MKERYSGKRAQPSQSGVKPFNTHSLRITLTPKKTPHKNKQKKKKTEGGKDEYHITSPESFETQSAHKPPQDKARETTQLKNHV